MKALITNVSLAALLAVTGCAAAGFGTQAKDTSNTWQAYAGQVAGAVIGGLAANQVKSNSFRPVATAAGAVSGASVGSKITAAAGQDPAVELTYTYENCKGDNCMKTLVQRLKEDTPQVWKVGAHVRVTVGGGTGTKVIQL
ncbi:glycine zipper 2TM domain-containing protein [Roseateles sp. MS654]|uniref:glycine zipper 2TM domain-containing protein n=1 Tax=Roseateles sp. MS654 TaxID=3412685 RepID=UPI003C2C85D6